MTKRPYTNALIHENSPYLLQHAKNPVNWYPWGEEALEKAKRENKMLIVSIGYAACHWCHVMENESFEDTAVARIMNEHFIAIKVDREERPDIDDIYMSACQLTGGRNCGWPLNAFALPDGRPVWAGTYFPKQQWISLLNQFVQYQQKDRDRLESAAESLVRGLGEMDRLIEPEEKQVFDVLSLREITEAFLSRIDWQKGGRTGQPKFPLPNNYTFLLAYHHREKDGKSLEAVELTLQNMAFGGIYDQLGGGFARYSVDSDWFVPHFEKMLYDNAQLVSLYSQAFALTGDPLYKTTVDETLSFIKRELRSPEGAFYSSLDADSEGEEGKFYTWTHRELQAGIPDQETRTLFMAFYGIREKGNWEEGKNILHRTGTLEDFAIQQGKDIQTVENILQECRCRLMQIRSERIRPGLDDKVLTSWNAWMLKGLADAFRATGNPEYLDMALVNGVFIREKMMDADGRLWRSYKEGQRKINGFLEDYAATILAFLSLYELTFDPKWLDRSRRLADYALAHFYESSTATFYFTSDLDPALVARKTDWNDNVIPGSVSQMAHNLYQLGIIYSDDQYTGISRKLFNRISPTLVKVRQASYYSNWLALAMHFLYPPKEVVILGAEAEQYARQLQRNYLPDAFFIVSKVSDSDLPLTQGRFVPERTMIYVCQDRVCRLPVDSPQKAMELLGQERIS
jgi:uncharacterized protein YyaL (SSP411 family)